MSAATLGVVRVGTRSSTLARAQTNWVLDQLTAPTTVVTVSTEGDRSRAALAQIGGTGVFVSALREALLRGEIDAAVHSYKDLPTAETEGIVTAAVPVREDPRDALVARNGLTLGELPAGARVGTGSPRRAAQLRALGLGLEVVPIRGNVDTRLGKVAAGELDAVVLALAGLRRIARADAVTEVLDPLQLLPAPGQGALAVECRADDLGVCDTLAAVDDPAARVAVSAERALLIALEAGCSSPVGGLAEIADGDGGPEIYLRGSVTAVDGSDAVRLSATGALAHPKQTGRKLAADLLEAGADTMMERSE
ncbi:MAG: hydroxymethylbilane synthase [bacterium]